MLAARCGFLTVLITLFLVNVSFAQEESSLFLPPVTLKVPSSVLKDTETVELILPKDYNVAKDNHYPVIYLFDKQNKINYRNNIQAIDYMTMMNQMPPCIIVGISYTNRNRTPRTMPAYSKGSGDNMLFFLLDELYPLLVSDYRAANFKLFIGHSRTAIFSQYALSKRPKDINAVIASSTSYFDFGTEADRKLFDSSLNIIATLKRKAFFFFSVGDTTMDGTGDGAHAASVRKLDEYIRAKQLPDNLIWKSYFHQGANHNLTPGLTVAPALNLIFDRYDKIYHNLWSQPYAGDAGLAIAGIEKEFENASAYYGYAMQPNAANYVSMGYSYKSKQELGDKRFAIAQAIWQQGIKHYTHYEGFYSAIADLYIAEKKYTLARNYLEQALSNVDKSLYYDNAERETSRAEIKETLQQISKEK
ncbi:MAG: alpha/beta hydrolase-fold protein [Chitinophagaceae bacterium]